MVNSKVDEKPQLFHLNPANQETVNTYAEVATQVPSMIGPEGGYIMEILKAYIKMDIAFDTSGAYVQVHIAKRSQNAIVQYDDPDCIAFKMRRANLVVGGYWHEAENCYEIDLTDSNGNGILFGGKQIWLAVYSQGQNAFLVLSTAQLLYRLVKVKPTELIGVLQEHD